MKYLLWLLKAAIFFTLFAFALNNQQDATVHFFFGTQWRAPLVLVVLTLVVLVVDVVGFGHSNRSLGGCKTCTRSSSLPTRLPKKAIPS